MFVSKGLQKILKTSFNIITRIKNEKFYTKKGMKKMKIETTRLIITEFTMDMAENVHLNSLAG